VGTAANPIAADVKATIAIVDNGPIDTDWDPLLLSRGLLSHGIAEFHGAQVTPYVALFQEPLVGDTELVLSQIPVNWQVGDRLVLTGTNRSQNQDEELDILGISGNRVTISPLAFNHVTPASGLSIYVANVSRNISVISENPEILGRRGHVMFMHSDSVKVHNAGFYGLGRTDKSVSLTDPKLDANGKLIPGTGANPRGRYAVHFHKQGIDATQAPALVTGSVVVDSPGWGFVNHHSNVTMEDNVAFNVVGAAFATEDGSELGAFRRNLAIRSTGSPTPGDGIENREDIVDFGHDGHGFWFQGVGGIEVEDNIAVGQAKSAFVIFSCRCRTTGTPIETFFPAENINNPSIIGNQSVGSVPAKLFKGNIAFASQTGFESWYHLSFANHDIRTIIEDLTVWNVHVGAIIPYVNRVDFVNSRILGLGSAAVPSSSAFTINSVTANITYNNLHVEGFPKGVIMPAHGHNVVQGGYYNNEINFVVQSQRNKDGTLNIYEFNGVQTGPLTQTNIQMKGGPRIQNENLAQYFSGNSISSRVFIDGQRQYFSKQAPDFIPFPSATAPDYVPTELIGKTNLQLWNEFGLAVGGEVGTVSPTSGGASAAGAPFTGLKRRSRSNNTEATSSSPVGERPVLRLASDTFTEQLTGYQLVYQNEQGDLFTDPQPANLNADWNVITRTIDGHIFSFLVRGIVQPPSFVATGNTAIHPLSLPKGFRLRGAMTDDVVGTTNIIVRFSGSHLISLPVQERADGSSFVILGFQLTDNIGNVSDIEVELTLDPSLPVTFSKRSRTGRGDEGTPTEPEVVIILSETLQSLLDDEFAL